MAAARAYLSELKELMNAEGYHDEAIESSSSKVIRAVELCSQLTPLSDSPALHENQTASSLESQNPSSLFANLFLSNELVSEDSSNGVWRNRFRLAGYILSDDSTGGRPSILEYPVEVKSTISMLKSGQRTVALELLDLFARGPQGSVRSIRGAAGRGKCVVRKALEVELRRIGFRICTLGVAAIVALDTAGGGGRTVMSVHNPFATRQELSSIVYEMSLQDFIFYEEVGMKTASNLRGLAEIQQRAGALRRQRWGDLRTIQEGSQSDHGDFHVVAFGDLLQLGSSGGGRPVYRENRYWGSNFALRAMVLHDSMRNDPDLDEFAERLRTFQLATSTDSERAWLVARVRSREILPGGCTACGDRPPLDATILGPRFDRVADLGQNVVRNACADRAGIARLVWGENTVESDADLYAVGKKVTGEEDVRSALRSLPDSGASVTAALRVDHTRVPKLVLRTGMQCVLTVNKHNGSARSVRQEEHVLGLGTEIADQTSGFAACNGEIVTVTGIDFGRDAKPKLLKLQRSQKFGGGIIKMRKTASKGFALNTKENRKARLITMTGSDGKRRRAVVSWKQFEIILAISQTIHKAQGRTLECVIADLGAAKRAYAGGVMYTAVTRVKHWRSLFFLDVPEDDVSLLTCLQADAGAVFADAETLRASVWLEDRRATFSATADSLST